MAPVRELIDAAPISRLQIGVLILAGICNMAEGYDILSMALTVVGVSGEWGLNDTQAGWLLSSGMIGMAIGAFGLSPIGDRIGRKPLLLISLTLLVVGMSLSAIASGHTELVIYRLIAGIGMGGYIPSLPIIVGEFAPARKRSAMIGFYGLGIPVGGVVFGAIAASLIQSYGWRSAFVLGAVITAIMIVLVAVFLPESPEHLDNKKTEKSTAAVRRLLDRMNIDPDAQPAPQAPGRGASVLSGTGFKLLGTALVLTCLTWVLVNFAYSFANTWIPKLLVNAGMSATEGVNAALIVTLGGAVGTVGFGLLSMKIDTFRLTWGAAGVGAIIFFIFSQSTDNLPAAMIAGFALGVCLSAAFTGLYAIVPMAFVPEARVRVLGTAAAVGRLGGILSPLTVGVLLDAGWTPEQVFQLMIIPIALGAALLFVTAARYRRQVQTSSTPATAPRTELV